ncbi:hypothetical protein IAD21_04790 [Abditibacteriota bacterium]|nr:hypothetical protein IAD21_04790 [Abditibacteriota bacterium]
MSTLTNTPVSDYSQWQPEEYLREYYGGGEVLPDEHFAMEFLVEALKRLADVPIALEFGCGPTIHHALAMAPVTNEIHLADFLESNRVEVGKWLGSDPAAFNWKHFGKETLELEGNPNPTDEQIAEREALLRARVTKVKFGDAFNTNPLGIDKREYYPLVASHYCAEACTTDKGEWRDCMTNISSLVEPGGTLILSVCGAANAYAVGDRNFPCAGVDEVDVLSSLRDNGFTDIDVRVRQVPSQTEQGFSSVVFASAVKGRR